ncbi:MAG: hypothetical protein NVS4B8_13580 [Herpetosiphon sp.]
MVSTAPLLAAEGLDHVIVRGVEAEKQPGLFQSHLLPLGLTVTSQNLNLLGRHSVME